MNIRGEFSVLEQARIVLREIVRKGPMLSADVSVLARPLTPQEAIGEPGRRDFPIIIGNERVIEAIVLGAKGHAFTDSPREFLGAVSDVLQLPLTTNPNRAIFIATLNAVLNHLKKVTATVHCKDNDPEKCALEIADQLFQKHGGGEVGLVGFNPAIAEQLVNVFGTDHVIITDLNRDNIGRNRFGVEIWDGNDRTDNLIDASNVVILTGTTLVNGTFDHIWAGIQIREKDYLVYGVTAAGVSKLVGFDRICPYGRDE